MQLKKNFNTVLGKIIGWFQANSLTLNFNKTFYMYFKMKKSLIDNSPIKYMNKQTNSAYSTDFLGVTLHSTLSWQGHINKVITKLNSACFVING
jgi:DNA mismatch repair ATPase MutS